MDFNQFQQFVAGLPEDRLVVSISGVSGSGKTTLIQRVISKPQLNAGMIRSLTTRPEREGDGDDYEYVTESRFGLLKEDGELTWKVGGHGNFYGNTHMQYAEAMENFNVSLIAVTPETIPMIVKLIPLPRLRIIHLMSPMPSELTRRLKERGESNDEIKKRRDTCLDWDNQISKLSAEGIPISFIEQGTRNEIYRDFLKILKGS